MSDRKGTQVTKKKNGKNEIAVLVTTEHRGVFFGYVDRSKVDDSALDIRGARLCVRWTQDMQGFMGLASMGPSSGCRIGPVADIPSLRSITGVFAVTPEAEKKWKAARWS